MGALVDTYRKHLGVTADANERIELYTTMGQVYEEELRDLDRAIEAYNDVLSVEGDHPDALAGLARLYEETEQWERAVEMMRRLIQVSSDGKQKVDLNYRLGRIFDEQMKEPESAEEYLVEALSHDPAHVPSHAVPAGTLQAARRLAEGGAADGPRRGRARSTRWRRRACCTRRARSSRTKLGDEEQAAELFARVLQLDPEHVEAAEPLSELYFKREEWAPLVPILEMLARKADRKTNRELTLLYHRLAKAADQLGDTEKAREVLQAGVRPRFDLPADAARSGGAAVPPRAVGRRLQASTRPSWSTTARRRRTTTSSTSSSASATSS